MRNFRRVNSTASNVSTESAVQQDAEAVDQSLKAMQEFMKAMNSKSGRKKIMRTQSNDSMQSIHSMQTL